MHCYFVSDLHGKKELYEKLFQYILDSPPEILFVGGDILSHGYLEGEKREKDFILGYLRDHLINLQNQLQDHYPKIYIILGNDDPRIHEKKLIDLDNEGLLFYSNQQVYNEQSYCIAGYSFVPPTPFGLKDWEKYDVSRYVDPGCSHPFEGMRTVNPDYDPEYSNIKMDLEHLEDNLDLQKTIVLFHSPPYNTALDRAALDGHTIEHVPLDVHVGSIAIERFIKEKQPLVTLHGHIHEASSLTGKWAEKIGHTYSFNASYDKDKLSLVMFDTENLEKAQRLLL